MDSRFALALKYYDAGLPDEAWAIVREMLTDPGPALDVLGFAAALRLEARAFTEVNDLADRILARDPGNVGAWLFRAQALFLRGRTAEAEAACRSAAEMPGQHPVGWNNLGNVLDDIGRSHEARAAFTRAIIQAPDFSMAHNNLGANLAGQGQFAAASAAHRKALHCDPRNLAALNNLGVALLEQGLAGEAVSAFDAVLTADSGNSEAADNQLYAGIYTEDDPRAVHAAHAAWGKSFPSVPPRKPTHPDPERRLRVGYVSPDFRHHSVSFFLEPLLAAHGAAVEIFCYADVAAPDEVTSRLKRHAQHWRDVQGCIDEEVLALINADHIDILVDLAGHTKGNRLAVFARRAAPVQVTALGYPATTGLPTMDYRLCDALTDPALEADGCAVETLVRLASGLHCYAPPADAPPVGALPALTAGHITFGSFNKLAKISPGTVAAWARVLTEVPDSRLILKTKPLAEAETRARVEGLFAAHGVAAERLELRGWAADDRAHLALYNRVDVALDSFPYNGTTTTCEALWMGVPVLTTAGRGHAGRVGASLLAQIGLANWVAENIDQFVARAVSLAADRRGLADLRHGLRAAVASSALCDGPAYARAVETAYRAMWRRACGTQVGAAD